MTKELQNKINNLPDFITFNEYCEIADEILTEENVSIDSETKEKLFKVAYESEFGPVK